MLDKWMKEENPDVPEESAEREADDLSPLEGNLHAGHRQRVRERYMEQGLDSFNPINALELLLFYAVPQRDTNVLAHRLLDMFGSLANVFDAPADDLMRVKGVSENTAVLLKMIPDLARRYLTEKSEYGIVAGTPDALGQYLVARYTGVTVEKVIVVCLDNKQKIVAAPVIFEGSVNSASINTRKLVEYVIKYNASAIVLAHNHPSGLALPSSEDVASTQMLYNALKALGVSLLDHVVVADGDFVSMAQSGLIGGD